MYETLECKQCWQLWDRKVIRGRKPTVCPRCKYQPTIVRTRKTKASGSLIISDGGKSAYGYGLEKNDCAVRAVALACDVDYQTAYTFMAHNGRMKNKGAWFHLVIANNNYKILGKHVKPELVSPSKGLKTALLRNPKLRRGTWILHSTQHVAVLVDGVLFDSFDSSRKIINGAWRVLDA